MRGRFRFKTVDPCINSAFDAVRKDRPANVRVVGRPLRSHDIETGRRPAIAVIDTAAGPVAVGVRPYAIIEGRKLLPELVHGETASQGAVREIVPVIRDHDTVDTRDGP